MFSEDSEELKVSNWPHRILAKFIENSLSARPLLNTLNRFFHFILITALKNNYPHFIDILRSLDIVPKVDMLGKRDLTILFKITKSRNKWITNTNKTSLEVEEIVPVC